MHRGEPPEKRCCIPGRLPLDAFQAFFETSTLGADSVAGLPIKPSTTVPSQGQHHIVFVPVDGRLVFCVCLLLIAACVVWLLMLVSKGVKKFEEDQ